MQTLFTYISHTGVNALRQFNQHRGMQQGASLSFNTLLCFVPLSAVALFLLKTFGIVENEQSALIAALDNFLPNYGADEIVSGISEFTNRNLTGLGVGGFLLFLVVSLILFMAVEEHFNDIWGSRRRLPLMQAFQKYSIFYALLLVGPLLIWIVFSTVSFWVYAYIFPWISVYCLFFFMYIAFPNTSVKWSAALIGACVAGTLFQIARIGFSHYFALAWQNFSEVYGTLAMLIILAIWIYATWVVILLGAEVTNLVQYSNRQENLHGNLFDENKDYINPLGAITLFFTVAAHFHKGKGACSVADTAGITGVPQSLVNKIFEKFKAAGLIHEVEGDTKGYLPSRSLDTITLDSIITAVELDVDDHFMAVLSDMPTLTELFRDLQQTQIETLKEVPVSSVL